MLDPTSTFTCHTSSLLENQTSENSGTINYKLIIVDSELPSVSIILHPKRIKINPFPQNWDIINVDLELCQIYITVPPQNHIKHRSNSAHIPTVKYIKIYITFPPQRLVKKDYSGPNNCSFYQ